MYVLLATQECIHNVLVKHCAFSVLGGIAPSHTTAAPCSDGLHSSNGPPSPAFHAVTEEINLWHVTVSRHAVHIINADRGLTAITTA